VFEDTQGQSISMTVDGLQPFMSLNTETNSIQIEDISADKEGSYPVTITLTNEAGLSKSYSISIHLKMPPQPEPQSSS
jgi:hypothetical protein